MCAFVSKISVMMALYHGPASKCKVLQLGLVQNAVAMPEGVFVIMDIVESVKVPV